MKKDFDWLIVLLLLINILMYANNWQRYNFDRDKFSIFCLVIGNRYRRISFGTILKMHEQFPSIENIKQATKNFIANMELKKAIYDSSQKLIWYKMRANGGLGHTVTSYGWI